MCMRMIPVFIGVPGSGLAGSMPGKHIGNYHPVSLVLPPLFPRSHCNCESIKMQSL